jgi:hypothetical protein
LPLYCKNMESQGALKGWPLLSCWYAGERMIETKMSDKEGLGKGIAALTATSSQWASTR